jgi:hypothetical protein
MMWLATTGFLKAQSWLKNFHRDRKGMPAAVDNVLWITVGVFILLGVLGLVYYFWGWLQELVSGPKGVRKDGPALEDL